MSEDWESVTRIGSSVRRAPGTSANRETVARTAAEINAARRAGAVVGVEKKFGTVNSAGTNQTGQHLTKVDRSDDIIAPSVMDTRIGPKISEMRNKAEPKMKQEDLARRCNVDKAVIASFESGKKNTTDKDYQKTLGSIENTLNIVLRGEKFGEPKRAPKKK